MAKVLIFDGECWPPTRLNLPSRLTTPPQEMLGLLDFHHTARVCHLRGVREDGRISAVPSQVHPYSRIVALYPELVVLGLRRQLYSLFLFLVSSCES